MASPESDALLFLEDLAGDVPEVFEHHHDLLTRPLSLAAVQQAEPWRLEDDSELLSTLLASPPPSQEPVVAGDALEQTAAQLQISPLAFFPPSDDETTSEERPQPPTTSTTLATNPPLKAKRKKPNRSPNYNPNRARNARRHELIYLRDKVTEMEHELRRLQDATTDPRLARDEPTPQSLVPAISTLMKHTPGQTAWEKIASRQLSERRRAERENERLKIVLETQLKIAKSLEHLLHKRTTMQGLDECGLAKQKRVFANEPVQSDAGIFNELLRQVHECYLEAERHFESFGIGSLESSCRDARIRDGDSDKSLRMEIFVNELLPFPVHAAGKAAWQYFSHDKNHLPFRLYYERVSENMGLPEDTIVENSGLELQVNSTKAIFNLKQVIRRYVEPDRVVVSYSAVAQPVEFASKPVWGCDFREWGCMVLSKPVAHDAASHCVLKTCYFITPEFHCSTGDSDNHERNEIIGELTEFVLSSTAATMAAWLQMIENILVVEQIDSAASPADR